MSRVLMLSDIVLVAVWGLENVNGDEVHVSFGKDQ